ncbi:hypothetical protein VP01_3185g2 [Puccinia sorghi]|uniref:Uncharacterized protein n=1 Tax=Puccinia sorghi TaxID=27349 RepID=A0A0L6UZE0_9BASI|nr:hypothetical protein VP01_3185g2 [Puccinia sorghi]
MASIPRNLLQPNAPLPPSAFDTLKGLAPLLEAYANFNTNHPPTLLCSERRQAGKKEYISCCSKLEEILKQALGLSDSIPVPPPQSFLGSDSKKENKVNLFSDNIITSTHLGTDVSKGKPIPPEDLIDLTNEANDGEENPKTQESSAHKNPAKCRCTLIKELSLGPDGSHPDLKSDDSPSTRQPQANQDNAAEGVDDPQSPTQDICKFSFLIHQHLATQDEDVEHPKPAVPSTFSVLSLTGPVFNSIQLPADSTAPEPSKIPALLSSTKTLSLPPDQSSIPNPGPPIPPPAICPDGPWLPPPPPLTNPSGSRFIPFSRISKGTLTIKNSCQRTVTSNCSSTAKPDPCPREHHLLNYLSYDCFIFKLPLMFFIVHPAHFLFGFLQWIKFYYQELTSLGMHLASFIFQISSCSLTSRNPKTFKVQLVLMVQLNCIEPRLPFLRYDISLKPLYLLHNLIIKIFITYSIIRGFVVANKQLDQYLSQQNLYTPVCLYLVAGICGLILAPTNWQLASGASALGFLGAMEHIFKKNIPQRKGLEPMWRRLGAYFDSIFIESFLTPNCLLSFRQPQIVQLSQAISSHFLVCVQNTFPGKQFQLPCALTSK